MGENQDGRVFAQQGNEAAATDASGSNDAVAGAPARKHARRTVGVTEQRLRDANRQSWMTSRTGWTTWLRRFMPGRD